MGPYPLFRSAAGRRRAVGNVETMALHHSSRGYCRGFQKERTGSSGVIHRVPEAASATLLAAGTVGKDHQGEVVRLERLHGSTLAGEGAGRPRGR